MEKNKKIIVVMAFLVLSALAVGFLTYPHAGKVDAAQDIKNDIFSPGGKCLKYNLNR